MQILWFSTLVSAWDIVNMRLDVDCMSKDPGQRHRSSSDVCSSFNSESSLNTIVLCILRIVTFAKIPDIRFGGGPNTVPLL